MIDEEYRFGLTESPEIVKALKQHTIKNIVRAYNKITLDDYIEKDSHIPVTSFFNRIPGVILLYLDNDDIIGFAGEDIKGSVVVWFDTKDGVHDYTTYYDREYFSFMQHNDITYADKDNWSDIVGHVVTNIQVLKVDRNEKQRMPDSLQRGIILETPNGNMLISFCLRLPNGGVLALNKKSDITDEIWNCTEVIQL